MVVGKAGRRGLFAFDHGHHVFLTHHDEFIAIHLDLGTAVLAEEDLVPHLEVERANVAVFQNLALADGNHLSKYGFLGRSIRDHDAAWGLTLFFFSFHDHAVMKGTNLHKTRLLMLGLS